jgi:hypothetical protein
MLKMKTLNTCSPCQSKPRSMPKRESNSYKGLAETTLSSNSNDSWSSTFWSCSWLPIGCSEQATPRNKEMGPCLLWVVLRYFIWQPDPTVRLCYVYPLLHFYLPIHLTLISARSSQAMHPSTHCPSDYILFPSHPIKLIVSRCARRKCYDRAPSDPRPTRCSLDNHHLLVVKLISEHCDIPWDDMMSHKSPWHKGLAC